MGDATYYGQLNGGQGFRVWRDVAGFRLILEYPDLPSTGNISAVFGDRRAFGIAMRSIRFSNAAEELGVPTVMDFYNLQDPETKMPFTGVAYQLPGTGDVIVSAAALYGVCAGNQGGAPGAKADNAALLIKTS